MEKRILGRTNLSIAPLGFGGMELWSVEQKQANILLNTALDNGINYIDTSPEYGWSEELIGNAAANRRQEFYLATKCGDTLNETGPAYKWDRKTCRDNLERSLKLLKTDYIDVWQLHAVMPEYITNGECDDVIQYMQDVKKEGKIRFIGATINNGKPEEDMYPAEFGYKGLKEFMNWTVLDVIQIVYGALTRRNELVIEKAAEKGIGMVARGVVKKYKSNYQELLEKSRIVELFEENETQNNFLIRFALTNPSISCMVIGTKNERHLIDNIKAINKGALSTEIYNEAKLRLDSVGITPGTL